MIAVVKEHAGPGFAVKDVPYPVLREDDVIIKVRSVGICGTDGPILAGTREVPWPLIPGHESGRSCDPMYCHRMRGL